jgi:hypothetical protein
MYGDGGFCLYVFVLIVNKYTSKYMCVCLNPLCQSMCHFIFITIQSYYSLYIKLSLHMNMNIYNMNFFSDDSKGTRFKQSSSQKKTSSREVCLQRL